MNGRTVRITLEYELARVPLRHRRLVEPLLSAPTVRVRAEGGVTTLARVRLRAGARAGKHYTFPAKYVGVVVPALETLGYQVTVVSTGRGLLPTADSDQSSESDRPGTDFGISRYVPSGSWSIRHSCSGAPVNDGRTMTSASAVAANTRSVPAMPMV